MELFKSEDEGTTALGDPLREEAEYKRPHDHLRIAGSQADDGNSQFVCGAGPPNEAAPRYALFQQEKPSQATRGRASPPHQVYGFNMAAPRILIADDQPD